MLVTRKVGVEDAEDLISSIYALMQFISSNVSPFRQVLPIIQLKQSLIEGTLHTGSITYTRPLAGSLTTLIAISSPDCGPESALHQIPSSLTSGNDINYADTRIPKNGRRPNSAPLLVRHSRQAADSLTSQPHNLQPVNTSPNTRRFERLPLQGALNS